ncbi:MAG: hypothetical protein RLZZ502_1266, partial [Pseudomonadota bacterium]
LPLALETQARLWTALTGFATLLALFAFMRRQVDFELAICSTVILASMLWFYAMGHINTLDMGLSNFLTLALLCFLSAFRQGIDPSEQKKCVCLMWGNMALAFLSKGLVGILIPAASLFLYCVCEREWKFLRQLHWGKGLLILLSICLPWMLLAHQRNPEFFDFFIVHEHFTRFLDRSHKREGAWYYFVPILLAGLVPWTLYAFAAARTQTRVFNSQLNLKLFLLLWGGFIFFFFSISKSKLPSYILPMFPALAILLALGIKDLAQAHWRLGLLLPFCFSLILLFYPSYLPVLATEFYPIEILQALSSGLLIAGAFLLLVTLIAYLCPIRWQAVVALALGFMLTMHLVFHQYEKLHPQFSGYEASVKIRAEMGDKLHTAPLYSLLNYDQTLAPYLGRTLTLVEYVDEFALGQKAAPEKHIARMEGFFAPWLEPQQQFAVADARAIKLLNTQQVPYTLVFKNQRYSFIKRLNQ